jgi:glucose/arabinose dehydrogenase
MSCGKDSRPPDEDSDDWPADSVRTVASQLSYPWEIIWGPDDHIWMTERGGRISRIEPRTGDVRELLTISEVRSNGEGGLLGMALHPSFDQQPYVYVVYNYDRNGSYLEKVVRYTYGNNTLNSPQVLLDNINAAGIHNGSRLLISSDNKLWITTGDASNSQDAQRTNIPNGKVLRINLDGSIPADNPFPGNPVWSYGHRNPQGLVFAHNRLYASEHGPNVEDEVNIIERQRNYGWPAVNGPCDESGETSFCNQNNVQPPIWSSGNSTVATSGMDHYNNERIPQWSNSLLLTTLKSQRLYQLQLSADGQQVTGSRTWFNNAFGRLRDVCVSPAGRVYLCTSNGNNDRVIEISSLD